MKQIAEYLTAIVSIIVVLGVAFWLGQREGKRGLEEAIKAERMAVQAEVDKLEQKLQMSSVEIETLEQELGNAEEDLQDALDLTDACRPDSDELRALQDRWGT